jgi:hypothetical protein
VYRAVELELKIESVSCMVDACEAPAAGLNMEVDLEMAPTGYNVETEAC